MDDYDDLKEFFLFFFAIGGGVLIILGLCCGLAFIVDYNTCSSQGRRMNVNYEWGPFERCMIERTPGNWMPLSALKFNEVKVK